MVFRIGNCKRAFSLIELMIVISIIGLLASVSVPEFQKYKLKAKFVEAYAIVGAIKNAQMASFQEHGYFYGDALIAKGGESAKSLGSKMQLAYNNTIDEVQMNFIGNPIPIETPQYFAYNIVSRYLDGAGDMYRPTIDDETGEVAHVGPNAAEDTYAGHPFRDSDGAVSACSYSIEYASIGVSLVPNEHWSLIVAGSDMTEHSGSGPCTTIMMGLYAYDGQQYTTPFISFNIGE